MKLDRKGALSLAMVGALLLLAGIATATDIPLKNWSVPGVSTGALTKFVDIGNPGPFVAMTPCRLADTRGVAYPAAMHPPSLAASTPQSWTVTGNCGVPAGATAVSANFTATNALGLGFLIVWPQGGSMPTVSTLNYSLGQTVANAAIVPLGVSGGPIIAGGPLIASGGITLIAGVSGTDVIMDVNGYFTNLPNNNNDFYITGIFDGSGAIVGRNYSNITGSYGVGGYADGLGIVHGVVGQIGVAAAANSAGVHGIGAPTAGKSYGVLGETSSTVSRSAAVEGRLGGANWTSPNLSAVGVRGIADGAAFNAGVIGEGTTAGVIGYRVTNTGGILTRAWIGYTLTDGVYTPNDLTCTGTKNFVEPHPSDPTRVIKYVALEGPEAGTYFRGRGRFDGKTAVISVPEDFRMVTEEEGLTVQITPIGRAAAVGVVSMDLNQIVAESTRDVEFSYLVQGVRRAFRDFQPIQSDEESSYFKPRTADEKLDRTLPAELQKRLIASGIYHSDGTLNMNTAERLGWAREWREREEKVRAAAAAKAAGESRPGNGQGGQ